MTPNQCGQSENSVLADIVWLMPLCVNALIYTYCLWVGQRPEPVVVLLSCCIPQAQVHWFPINHHIGRVVVKPVEREVFEFIKHDCHLPHCTDGLAISPFADHFHDTAIREQCVCVCVLLTLWGCTLQGRHW